MQYNHIFLIIISLKTGLPNMPCMDEKIIIFQITELNRTKCAEIKKRPTLKTFFFFAQNPSPPQKVKFLGISITPEPFDGFSSKFQISCVIPIHCFWKKILATPHT